jgi:hypothetical protein
MKRADVGPLAYALYVVALATTTAVVEELRGGVIAAVGVVRDVMRPAPPRCLVEGVVCDFVGDGDDGKGACLAVCWYAAGDGARSCGHAPPDGDA